MKNNKKELAIEKDTIVRRIILTVIFVLMSIAFSFIERKYFTTHTDSYYSNKDSWLMFIGTIVVSLLISCGCLLNIFIFKNRKIHFVLCSICDGGTWFFVIASLINLLAYYPEFYFDPNYIQIFVTSSFSLLGFGLTICAVMTPFFINAMNKSSDEKRIDTILSQLMPFVFVFMAGLVFTSSCLLNLHIKETSFYKMIIYKALFYSITQILFIVIHIISLTVNYVWYGKKNNKNQDN